MGERARKVLAETRGLGLSFHALSVYLFAAGDEQALHDGSCDLSAPTPEEAARNILQMVRERLSLDRGGIFLREGELLRGFWGMDEAGQITPIGSTVFPLYPERHEEVTHAALVARGEESCIELEEGDGRALLRVADDGVGLPADRGIDRRRTLGMHIVSALTRKLRGELILRSGPGTTGAISFPLSGK